MRRKLLCACCMLLALCMTLLSQAQGYNKDSMLQVVEQIRKTPVDTSQTRKLRELGYDIGENDSALARTLVNEALTKSLKLGDAADISNSWRMLGLWYAGANDKDQAEACYRASREAARKAHLLYLEGGACFNLGNIKYLRGEYDSCIDYFLMTQELFENPKVFDEKSLTQRVLDKKKSDLYYNISIVFNTLKNLPKADEYIEKALAIARSYKNEKVIAFYTQQKADNYASNGDTEKALRTRLQFLTILEQSDLARVYVQGYYQNIAQEYYELDKTDSAKIYAQKSLSLGEELEVPAGTANANWLLGQIALDEKQYTMAAAYLEKSKAYYMETDDPTEKRNYYDVEHQLLFATGRFKEAYESMKQYQVLNDSIQNSERAQQFSEREARYQSEKKDAQIRLQQSSLKQKNLLNMLLGVAVLVLLLGGVLVWRNYKQKQIIQKQRIAELEAEKQLAATESVLKGEEQERSRLAKDLHDGLGGMLSGIKYSLNTMKGNLVMTPENAQAFERSIDMLDSSIKEMRRVAHNMMPEALVKFGLDTALRDFCTDINQSGALRVSYQSIGLETAKLDHTAAVTVYRVVQELVNNAIKHAAASSAIVQVSKSDGELTITVEDDGKGFDPIILQASKGIGWSNIQSRVEYLRGKMDVQSAPGKGTSVHIEIKA